MTTPEITRIRAALAAYQAATPLPEAATIHGFQRVYISSQMRAYADAAIAQQSTRHAEELAAYELTVSNLKALRVPDAMPVPNWVDEGQHYAIGWNTCRDAMLSSATAPEPERKPMKAADIVALHKSIEPEAAAISELMLRTIRAVESFHGIKEKP